MIMQAWVWENRHTQCIGWLHGRRVRSNVTCGYSESDASMQSGCDTKGGVVAEVVPCLVLPPKRAPARATASIQAWYASDRGSAGAKNTLAVLGVADMPKAFYPLCLGADATQLSAPHDVPCGATCQRANYAFSRKMAARNPALPEHITAATARITKIMKMTATTADPELLDAEDAGDAEDGEDGEGAGPDGSAGMGGMGIGVGCGVGVGGDGGADDGAAELVLVDCSSSLLGAATRSLSKL